MKNIVSGFILSAATVTTTHAVVYTLPSGDDVALAQLASLPDYAIVCDSNTEICDVPAGTYHQVVYDAAWDATQGSVVVSAPVPGQPTIVVVEKVEQFMIEVTEEPPCCEAFEERTVKVECPENTLATGMSCRVIELFNEDYESLAHETHLTATSASCSKEIHTENVTSLHQHWGFRVSVNCLSFGQ